MSLYFVNAQSTYIVRSKTTVVGFFQGDRIKYFTFILKLSAWLMCEDGMELREGVADRLSVGN
jgi:hypothetical protein